MQANLLYHEKSTILGEGPVWNHLAQQLIWVDIKGSTIHTFDPETGEKTARKIGNMISCLAPIDADNYIMASKDGFGYLHLPSGKIELITNPEADLADNRFNDGKCDPAGRFWAGSMNMVESLPTGNFFRLNQDLSVDKQFGGVKISNGLAWNKAKNTMYYIDTLTFQVSIFDYDLASGEISNRRSLCEIRLPNCGPDGMTIDENDNLWVAVYGAGAIWHIDGKTGEKLGEIKVAAEKTSCCTFGGKALDTLFITTIAENALESDVNAGALFSCKPGVKGREVDCFGSKITDDSSMEKFTQGRKD